jgi:hypothetical protein
VPPASSAKRWWCVTSRTERTRPSARSRATSAAASASSSPAVGSSARSTGGSDISARATASRRCQPRDSSTALRPRCAASSPSPRAASRPVTVRVWSRGLSADRLGSAETRFSRTVSRKKRACCITSAGRRPWMPERAAPAGAAPSSSALPQVTSEGWPSFRPARVRSSVDFPQPDGPTSTDTPVRGRSRLTSARTTCSPKATPNERSWSATSVMRRSGAPCASGGGQCKNPTAPVHVVDRAGIRAPLAPERRCVGDPAPVIHPAPDVAGVNRPSHSLWVARRRESRRHRIHAV